MKHFFKSSFMRWIESKGYVRLDWHQHSGLTGVSLERDLRTLVDMEDAVCFDVGANRGQTIELFTELFPRSVVHAFEPSPSCFFELRDKYGSERIVLNQLGLAEEAGELEFNEYDESVLSSFLEISDAATNPFREHQVVRKQLVRVSTLDQYARDTSLDRIDLLKTDTQGYDLNVLRGGGDVLRKYAKVLMVEMNFVPMYKTQGTAIEILSFLTERGFGLVGLYDRHFRNNQLAWATGLFTPTKS